MVEYLKRDIARLAPAPVHLNKSKQCECLAIRVLYPIAGPGLRRSRLLQAHVENLKDLFSKKKIKHSKEYKSKIREGRLKIWNKTFFVLKEIGHIVKGQVFVQGKSFWPIPCGKCHGKTSLIHQIFSDWKNSNFPCLQNQIPDYQIITKLLTFPTFIQKKTNGFKIFQ